MPQNPSKNPSPSNIDKVDYVDPSEIRDINEAAQAHLDTKKELKPLAINELLEKFVQIRGYYDVKQRIALKDYDYLVAITALMFDILKECIEIGAGVKPDDTERAAELVRQCKEYAGIRE